MDLEELLEKDVNTLTIEEVRFLQSNIKGFIEKQKKFTDNYGSYELDEYESIVITETDITINGDNIKVAHIDKIFKNFLVQGMLNVMQNRADFHSQKELDLANRIVNLKTQN